MEAKRLCAVAALLVTLAVSGCEPYSDSCKVGRVGDCLQGTVCYAQGNTTPGAAGKCVIGELDAAGNLKVTVDSWQLARPGEAAIEPLRYDANDIEGRTLENPLADNPNAGWVGKGALELHLSARGSSDVGTQLEIIAGGKTHETCKPVDGKCRGATCEWLCLLPEGWAGEDPEIEVAIKLGEQRLTRKRTYRVSTRLPVVQMDAAVESEGVVEGPLRLGEEVSFCATQGEWREGAADMPSIRDWVLQSAKLSSGAREIAVAWKQETRHGGRPEACWRGTPPLTAWLEGGTAEVVLDVVLRATDAAGNALEEVHKRHFTLTRHFCEGRVPLRGNAEVTEPLAFVSLYNRLVVGAGAETPANVEIPPNDAEKNRLYFYEGCTLAGEFHSGHVRGPMVVMGDTGRMAVATGGGGPRERDASRVALVNAQNAAFHNPPSASPSRDCATAADLETASNWLPAYSQGVALVWHRTERGWRFVAPGHSTYDYGTGAGPGSGHFVTLREAPGGGIYCSSTDPLLEYPYHLTPVVAQSKEGQTLVVARYGQSFLGYWEPRMTVNDIGWMNVSPRHIQTDALSSPSGMAATAQHVWLSGHALDGPSLQRWDYSACASSGCKTVAVQDGLPASPPVIDSQERVYVVVDAGDGAYQLRRFAVDAGPGVVDAQVPLPGLSAPVGSPLLGEALDGSLAELYIVTTTGALWALHADTLEFLWAMELGIDIAATAQPVLTGNLLWLVGTGGELRAIRVASNGLNRTAHWPKAFHDNCNTSNTEATAHNMPGCFSSEP